MSLLTLVRGDGENPFDASAIEDHGGTKMKTNGADSARVLRSLIYLLLEMSGTYCNLHCVVVVCVVVVVYVEVEVCT